MNRSLQLVMQQEIPAGSSEGSGTVSKPLVSSNVPRTDDMVPLLADTQLTAVQMHIYESWILEGIDGDASSYLCC